KFFLDTRPEELDAILDNFKVVVGDAKDTRLDVCTAFFGKDGHRFERALEVLISEHEQYYRDGIARDEVLEEEWATEGQLFVEGIALVRLAKMLELPTQRDYQHIPSLVLETSATHMDSSSWRELSL